MVSTLLKCFNAVKKLVLSWTDRTTIARDISKISNRSYESLAFFGVSAQIADNAMAANADMSNFYKTTDNGANWTKYDTSAFKTLYTSLSIVASSLSFAYGNGILVVVGTDSTGITSGGTKKTRSFYTASASINWKESNFYTVAGTNSAPSGKVQFLNGVFIIGLSYSSIMYSADGNTWTKATVSSTAPNYFGYGNGKYIGFYGKTLYMSTDLITWTKDTTYADPMPYFNGVNPVIKGCAYGNNTFVIAAANGSSGGVLYSTDYGKSWTFSKLIYFVNFNRVVFANSKFYLLSDGSAVASSSDGISWITLTSPFTGGGVGLDIFYGVNNKFMALDSIGNFYSSTDANTWTLSNAIKAALAYTIYYSYPNFYTSVFALGRFIIAGAGTSVGQNGSSIMPSSIYSTDGGATWNNDYPNGSSLASVLNTMTINDIIYENNYLIAVGYTVAAGTYFAYSMDGINWSSSNTIMPNENRVKEAKKIAYGNGVFIAVGKAVYISVNNGLDWTLIKTDTVMYYSVAYGNNTFVKVGASGAIEYSIDNGNTWTAAINTGGNTFATIVFANGKFITTGVGGYIYTSIDGINWNTVSSSNLSSMFISTIYPITKIIWTGEYYMVCGETGTNTFIVATSLDLITWKDVTPANIISIPLNTITYTNKKIVLAGSNGLCAQGIQN